MSRQAERFEAPAEHLGYYYGVFVFPYGDPANRQIGVLFNDISARKKAEEHRTVLIHELNHRVKNTLAMVQAIARQTFREGAVTPAQALRSKAVLRRSPALTTS